MHLTSQQIRNLYRTDTNLAAYAMSYPLSAKEYRVLNYINAVGDPNSQGILQNQYTGIEEAGGFLGMEDAELAEILIELGNKGIIQDIIA